MAIEALQCVHAGDSPPIEQVKCDRLADNADLVLLQPTQRM